MILVCPTAFKGTLSATVASAAMADGARAVAPGLEVRIHPLSDGGNGLLDAYESAEGGTRSAARVAGPLGAPVTARYLVQPDRRRVVLETAEACGLHLVPEPRRDPFRTGTRGVGELLLAAAGAVPDARRFVVGLGGSATVDAGAGMVTSLGWRLLDDAGEPITPGAAGLLDLARIEPPEQPPRLPPLEVLADVTNPLLGPNGAAPVYGPQKGADEERVPRLEAALARWADVVRDTLGRDVAERTGAGAAGGLGAAFAAFLEARPEPGAGRVLEAIGFDQALAGATAVVTGEGAWDSQSSMGKAVGEVVRRAREAGVPVLVIAGRADAVSPEGVTVVTGRDEERGEWPGGALDAEDLTRIVVRTLPGLLPGARRS